MWWIHETIKQRKTYGVYYHVVQELELDSERFAQYFRMTKEQFGETMFQIEPLLALIVKTMNAKNVAIGPLTMFEVVVPGSHAMILGGGGVVPGRIHKMTS